MKILLVEDNIAIVKGLKYALEKNGYEFVHKASITETKKYLEEEQVDLIILDVALPDGSGFDIFEMVIRKLNIPTIFLTAKDEEDNIVKGLNLGAEDYITKPFSTKELLARISRTLLRYKKQSVITVKDIKFDMDRMIVYKGDTQLELTPLELKLLHLLYFNINNAVSRNVILDKIWEWTGNDVDDHTVTVYFKRIREKIKSDIIITVKGIGYRIDDGE